MRDTWTHSVTSAMTMPGFTGFTGVAKHLSEVSGQLISKQGVYAWYQRRASTGFPEKHVVSWVDSDRTLQLFSLAEVTAWFEARQM